MSGSQNYEYHLQLLDGLQRRLQSLKMVIDKTEKEYQKQINAMHGAGFYDDYIDPLKERYGVFRSKMQELQALIDEHKSKISRHEEAIRDLQARARS